MDSRAHRHRDPEEPARVFVPLPDLLRPDTTDPAQMSELAGWSVLDVRTFVAQSTPPTA